MIVANDCQMKWSVCEVGRTIGVGGECWVRRQVESGFLDVKLWFLSHLFPVRQMRAPSAKRGVGSGGSDWRCQPAAGGGWSTRWE